MKGDLSKEMEHLNIEEPKFEKWNELPPELKLECIKTLDFETRWNLRSTSHTERALVDTQKLEFEKIEIDYSHLCLEFLSSERMQISTKHKSEAMIPLLEYIFKHGTIEILQVSSGVLPYEKMDELWNTQQQVSTKVLKFDGVEDLGISFWLRCLNNKIEMIEIDSASEFDTMLSIASVSHAHFLQISNLSSFESVHHLAQIWMDKDAEIGRTFQAMVSQQGAFAQLSKNFPDKIVSETPEHVRIRTDNPAKHILLELDLSTHWFWNGTEEFLRMSVIPADLKEFNSDKSWIRVIENVLPAEWGSESSLDFNDSSFDDLFVGRGYQGRANSYYNSD